MPFKKLEIIKSSSDFNLKLTKKNIIIQILYLLQVLKRCYKKS